MRGQASVARSGFHPGAQLLLKVNLGGENREKLCLFFSTFEPMVNWGFMVRIIHNSVPFSNELVDYGSNRCKTVFYTNRTPDEN